MTRTSQLTAHVYCQSYERDGAHTRIRFLSALGRSLTGGNRWRVENEIEWSSLLQSWK